MGKRSLTILCQFGWLLIAAMQCWADAPAEQYYVKLAEIPPTILRDAKGAVSILCQDPAFMKKYRDKHVDEVKVRTFKKEKDGFREAVAIELEKTQPLSGWLFDGTRVRRFPVVARNGEYLNIVYDVKNDHRAWICAKDVSNLMPKGWGSSLHLAWFGGELSKDEITIDVFQLLTSKKRTLYRAPSKGCTLRTVSSESDLQKTTRGTWIGNLVITEQRDGFARLGVRDPCGEEALRYLGWIRLRDGKGRLTVWPHVGLSC